MTSKEDEILLERGQEAVRLANSSDFEAYMDWPELPLSGYFVDFENPKRGALRYNGLYLRDNTKFDDVEKAGRSFQATINVKSVEGASCDQRDADVFRQAFKQYKSKDAHDRDGTARCFPLSELAHFLEASE